MLKTFWNECRPWSSAQRRDFVLERARLQRPLHQQAEVLRIGRFGQEIERPKPHRLDGVFDAAVTGGDNHRNGDLLSLDRLDELHSGDLRHPKVGDDEAIGSPAEHLQRLASVLGGIDIEFEAQLEQFLKGRASILQILDHEDPLGKVVRHGRCNRSNRCRVGHARFRVQRRIQLLYTRNDACGNE